METKMSKTKENISFVRKYIYDNYKVDEVIDYHDIETYLHKYKLHGMTFYYLVYSKCCIKMTRGKYKITTKMFTMDVDKIIELSQVVLKEKKYTRIAKNKNKKTITPNLFQTSTQKKQKTQAEILTEQICIDFLKKRNYKISKQVIQYEEI
jgi:hypothetical protein